ncbi:MAG: flagellar motor switch protein FliN [Candidatus Liberibacter europaeus]|uniref:Flagellar motor switch protein FliN n=1 Tax=Candidatus Liberibacter europaeus TaxID=744859 RepID=A0A2T4VXL9_9HYPH|nr:flagellar motor switch protein FliN [Candidatus Liberibacter europaeus]PTL86527.1 MAG: flagellar motor switch protein FliN [Candidatus Liberibacter europaeus]
MNIDIHATEDHNIDPKEEYLKQDHNISQDDSFNNSITNNTNKTSSSNTNNTCEKFSDNIDLVMNIPINIQIILGSCCMQIADLVNLSKGDVIKLDRKIGEYVDVTINNQKIAKGEITIMEDDDTRFGVKILEILNS